MPDLLVNLHSQKFKALAGLPPVAGVAIRAALAPEMALVVDWVRENFSDNWASEVTVAFSRRPAACLIAVSEGQLIGFACHDIVARGFFGPTGVHPDARGRGVGVALLAAALSALKANGYAYAVIGDAGPVDFYARTVGATPIPAEDKGVYEGMLRRPKSDRTREE
ncbi:GNAT family N-acetyltransferase [Rhizobium sp. LjRoot98]|uniref:GNAT family N-acetyltransferase n=1 Tax=unclassified Rhizobium TaxID=2613769 RepID=UPI00071523E7|nr:GNAT family N-acetyltransferase [Rhizobium sp. Root1204]KQV27421.1 GNAT family acetyltransferase [Rhizobium sp. Root1204]